jgi:hypothetical protein
MSCSKLQKVAPVMLPLGVLAAALLAGCSSPNSGATPPPPRTRIGNALAAEVNNPFHFSPPEGRTVYVDISSSCVPEEEGARERRAREVTSWGRDFLLSAPCGSTLEYLVMGPNSGLPRSLSDADVVPRRPVERKALANAAPARLLAALVKTYRARPEIKGSYLIEDLYRCLCRLERLGGVSSLIMASDFQQISDVIPGSWMDPQNEPQLLAFVRRHFPPLSGNVPQRVSLVVLQQSGDRPNIDTARYVEVMKRLLSFWGVKDVRVAELASGT